jgi:hypothetical protein
VCRCRSARQPYYNLLNRGPEVEILPACDHYGIGVAPYSPIARGVLTGKYAPGVIPEGCAPLPTTAALWKPEFRAESFAIAQKLKEHAEKIGRTPMQFALAWMWANTVVTSVIAGPRTFEQWEDYSRRSARRGAPRTKRSSTRWSNPGTHRRRATTIRSTHSSGACSPIERSADEVRKASRANLPTLATP